MKNYLKQSLYLFLGLLIMQCSSDDDTPTIVQQLTPIPEVQPVMTDGDGNTYQSVTIGTQVWTTENLKTTKFNDGTPITEYTFATFGNDWFTPNNPMEFYQWANTDDLNNIHPAPLAFDYHGALYNHYAVESGKLIPEGWRLPTEQDYIDLENHLSANGFLDEESKALKATFGWTSNGNGTDNLSFNMLPVGYASALGSATGAQSLALYGTSDLNTMFPGTSSQTRKTVSFETSDAFDYQENSIAIGFGIRCIKN